MIAGTIVIGVVVALAVVQFFMVRIGISALLVLGLIVVIAVIIPACVLFEKSLLGDWLDAALWVYLAAEMAFTAILWRLSTGGWFNYAIQAVVIACVLTGRAAGACLSTTPRRGGLLLPAVLAALAVPVFALTDVNQVRRRRADENAGDWRGCWSTCRDRPPRSSSSTCPAQTASTDGSTWSTIPGFTRFSSRSVWPNHDRSGSSRLLRRARCASSPPRRVGTEIDGLKRTLPDLGYQPVQTRRALFRLGPARRRRRSSSHLKSRRLADYATATLSVEFARCYTRGT